ncbi:MAG TPA: 3-dehydroquinate synthase [Gemmatimonadaceae bacterium]|nr:3-dehydroquinate synthase [Gemmatimonadaceae bacterium]
MPEVSLGPVRVTVAQGALDTLGARVRDAATAHRYVVISDETVAALHGERALASLADADLRAELLTFPAGEAHKTRETWASLTDRMLAAGLGRDTTVVALGGGVVGDLAGFVAATFMRGVPVVQVPTTLLAMIDAAVGGKTGVDTPAGKNLVGAFHQPALVVADPLVLGTLPAAQLRSGLAEAIKHGVLADEHYFDRVVAALPALLAPGGAVGDEMTALVVGSVEIKAGVVARDEREGGVRKTLNFGHTLGHAVETWSEYRLLHGEAVAIGMALESELAERAGIAECGTHDRVREALERAGLPAARPGDADPRSLLALTRGDKKARGGVVEYALPRRVGAMAGEREGWSVAVPDDLVLEVLA